MIEKVSINNFQSHKNSVLEFGPGVNVIVGPSDSGKSAVIRALRWAIWNRPLGKSFQSNWGGETEVTITTNDHQVTRFKGKGGDKYVLDNQSPYKAFGSDAPEEITKALNISEVNLQSQMDSAFLISQNPGEIARHFNRIANIDQIDSSLKTVESWTRRIKQDIESTESEIQRHEQQLEEYKHLNALEVEVEALEGLDSRVQQYRQAYRRLHQLISDTKEVQKDIEDKSKLLPAEEKADKLIKRQKKLKKKSKEAYELRELIGQIKSVYSNIQDLQYLLESEEAVNHIIGLYNEVGSYNKKSQELKKLINDYRQTEKSLKKAKQELKEHQTEWANNLPEVCPLCGNKT